MKTVAVLLVVLCCAPCKAQVSENQTCPCSHCSSDTGSLATLALSLGAVGEKVTNMAEKMAYLETKMVNAEKEVLELRSLIGGAPQVAFSATLRDTESGDTGPFQVDTPLQYKNVFANTGQSYNPSTGFFTAMVKGMFFFRFSMFNNLKSTPNSAVSLKKNGVRLVSVWDLSGADGNDMGSNAVVIPLEVGDTVSVDLLANRVIYDDGMHYNTFSGFLLFTM
ncbi:complement C1q-like protein 2 [Genypterus blacodes]|uniref:complement C1q-like protein 2 n=1 Tax=Genypterus blacodes TaxID=154954 RepID=UPI003F759488